jgi:hypothetical protein
MIAVPSANMRGQGMSRVIFFLPRLVFLALLSGSIHSGCSDERNKVPMNLRMPFPYHP